MKKYLIDTEFIRASKTRVHFLEIALLETTGNKILDFHLNANLNRWEKRYFSRATSGMYGEQTQSVFQAVEIIYLGRFNQKLAANITTKLGYDYHHKKLKTLNEIIPDLENSMLYCWDFSNDKELFNIIDVNNVNMVDVQAMWNAKFEGSQLSLINAYKHALYNLNIKDQEHLIESAHFAYCDVLLLKVVVNFIETYNQELKPIPMHVTEKEHKLTQLNSNIENLKCQITDLENELNQANDKEQQTVIAKKLVRVKKRISDSQKRLEIVANTKVYKEPWWL